MLSVRHDTGQLNLLELEQGKGRRKGGTIKPPCQSKPARGTWGTSMAYSARNHSIYMSQYAPNAVLQFSASNLQYVETASQSHFVAHPEGIVCTHGSMYVVSCLHQAVVQLKHTKNGNWMAVPGARTVIEDSGSSLIPWGMAAPPAATTAVPQPPHIYQPVQRALYVAVDKSYPADDYTTPPPFTSGRQCNDVWLVQPLLVASTFMRFNNYANA